ncbi:MAG: hypothetical protein CMO35_07260 [Verrucomicrobiaceae bacterium]|nr:hypothetical protein [Verrucomicrobiaceae bacterium]
MTIVTFVLKQFSGRLLRISCLFLLLAGSFHQVSAREKKVSVQLTVPDGGWKIRIIQVYQTSTHLVAVSKLERGSGPAIQVISKVVDSVKVRAPELPVRHCILGKTWKWQNKEPHTVFPSSKELAKRVVGAKLVFQAKVRKEPATSKDNVPGGRP